MADFGANNPKIIKSYTVFEVIYQVSGRVMQWYQKNVFSLALTWSFSFIQSYVIDIFLFFDQLQKSSIGLQLVIE